MIYTDDFNALDSSDIEVRRLARARLVEKGSAVVEPLIEIMLTQSGRRAWEAALILTQLDDPRWREPMCKMLTSTHPVLGQVAANALLRFGAECVDVLIAALPNSSYLTQIAIIEVLGKIGDTRAVVPLMSLLDGCTSSTLCFTLIETLGKLGDRRCIEVIRPFLDNPDHHVRKRAQNALALLSTEQNSL
jgi:HEAT repeat protein